MENQKHLSVGGWVITNLIMSIPFVGFVMLFVWGFGDASDDCKKNWARGTLLWIAIVIGFVIMMIFMMSMFAACSGLAVQ